MEQKTFVAINRVNGIPLVYTRTAHRDSRESQGMGSYNTRCEIYTMVIVHIYMFVFIRGDVSIVNVQQTLSLP